MKKQRRKELEVKEKEIFGAERETETGQDFSRLRCENGKANKPGREKKVEKRDQTWRGQKERSTVETARY